MNAGMKWIQEWNGIEAWKSIQEWNEYRNEMELRHVNEYRNEMNTGMKLNAALMEVKAQIIV